MDYQRLIEQTVTNGRYFISQKEIPFDNNTYTALLASLASMDGASYGEVKELSRLDQDLRELGLSDEVATQKAVQIALGLKRYITNLALSQARMVLDRDKRGELEFRGFHPKRLEDIISHKEENLEYFLKRGTYISKIMNEPINISKKEN